ncbi:MAG: dTMP kinase [Endomicrobium sp.]|nr:dTMP kinase [Endomicrobium sp.]
MNKKIKKHFFITVEGGECSGKTTHSLLLKEHLEEKGYKVLLTREPGGTICSEALRRILLDPDLNIISLSELFLYEAARAQHVKELIFPALKDGKVVICDRFIDSTVAYQGYGRKLNLRLIDKLNSFASFGLTPFLTIYLDIAPSEGLNKVKKLNKEIDRIERESVDFHKNVRRGYLKQAKKYPERIKIVKIQSSPKNTQILIRKIIDAAL